MRPTANNSLKYKKVKPSQNSAVPNETKTFRISLYNAEHGDHTNGLLPIKLRRLQQHQSQFERARRTDSGHVASCRRARWRVGGNQR